MGSYLLKRLLTLIATLASASALVFVVLEILPGDAALIMMGPDAAPEAVRALAAKLGLGQPALQRYAQWVGGLLSGELGDSYAYSSPVAELIAERLTVTVPLALMSMLLTSTLALVIGVYAASHHNRIGDVGLMGLTQLGIAIPNFWFAIVLILLFAVHLNGLPRAASQAGVRTRRRRSRRCCCPRSHWPWCSRPSWRASPARRYSTCCARTMYARPAPRGCRCAPPYGVTCCATP
jgi:peptide/nickel transport system permease protein